MSGKRQHVQLGILPELDTEGPPDYSGTTKNPLNQIVWRAAWDRGVGGCTAPEIAHVLKRSVASIAGRLCELQKNGKLIKTDAKRDGYTVYVAAEDPNKAEAA